MEETEVSQTRSWTTSAYVAPGHMPSTAQQSAAAAKNTVTITVKAAGKQHSELDSSLVYTQREPTGRRCRRIATKGQHRMWRKGQTRPDRSRDEGRPSQKATDRRAKEKGKKVMKMHFHFS